MESKLPDLDLIDLISERHLEVRKVLENLWNDRSDIYLSNSEWFILTRIYQKESTTISYVTKQVDISRQATHKFIKRLEEKGLVKIGKLENNKKERLIQLTNLGKDSFEKNMALKAELEKKIVDSIGEDKVKQLKAILQSNWEIS